MLCPRSGFRTFFIRYFDSCYYPGLLLALGVGGLYLATFTCRFWPVGSIAAIFCLLLAVVLLLCGVMCAVAWNVYRRRPGRLLVNGVVAAAAICWLVSLLPSREDRFAVQLVIPDDVEYAVLAVLPAVDEPWQAELSARLSRPGRGCPLVAADVLEQPALPLDELRKRLAASPRWRVLEVYGQWFAARRVRRGKYYFNGYQGFHRSRKPFYLFRLVVDLSGETLGGRQLQTVRPGVPPEVRVCFGGDGYDSELHFLEENWPLEIFECSGAPERVATNFLRRLAAADLRELAASPAAGCRGEPEFQLWQVSPGHYEITWQLNPGEPGLCYLQAFEVTGGTALSPAALKFNSLERPGYSDDPEEQFPGGCNVFIREGEPGQFYLARFEVWFRPASGAPERKLLEKTYRIEGRKN